ncbi:P-loop containing nucleoside triphosphate hydrolase protein, partial [Acephala macrosclerotiorum]
GQGPLPERIRIHSKHLIMILARIHGSKLVSEERDKNASLVLLRPFRLLSHYDKEIRDWQSKLIRDHETTKSGTEGSDIDAKQNPAEALKPNTDAKDAVNELLDVQSKEEKPSVDDPNGYSTSTKALQHLPCLLEFMDTYLSRKRAYLNSSACDKVTFSDIWHLFKPGDFVISTDGKQAYRVINVASPPHKGTDRWSYFYASEKENEKSRAQSDISIDCVYIHYDGKKLGPVLEKFKIRRFDGERSVTSLEIYPLRFFSSRGLRGPAIKSKQEGSEAEEVMETGAAQLSKELIERGKMFVEVAGVKHMYYAGLTVDTRDEVESQVVIDFEEAFASEHKREWCPKITPLVGLANNLGGEEDEETRRCKADCCWQENVHDDSYVETERSKKFTNDLMAEIEDSPHRLPSVTIYPRSLEDTKTEMNALKDDELLIMSYQVFGFVLRDRTWAQLDLSYLEYIDNDDDGHDVDAEDNDSDEEAGDKSAFGRLVLPKGHKKMVLSLIAQHFRNKGSQDEQADIVRGKGKGLIILLHGAPGVGKTTTAEGVAERFKKPLFQITCGDLGADAKQVETALQTNFALANRWGCILLLDEADVFLAERRREDFTRNGLVAVFLRVLEYYAGILFLTTNRIGDFDEAFASRIHMSLHYPPLDKISTTKVFKLNLGIIKDRYKAKGRKITIEKDEILENIGEYFRENKEARWNGRQIRNACQTALALAEFDAQPLGKKYDLKTKSTARVYLTASHLQIVSNAYLEFIQYLKEVHGTDADTHAKESGIRALETAIAAEDEDDSDQDKDAGKDPTTPTTPCRVTAISSAITIVGTTIASVSFSSRCSINTHQLL